MHILQILVLAVVQGAAELLPVSSSAHVIVAEKLMGLDATSPEMTFLLVMLHTGTMFAVIVYFWNAWRRAFFTSARQLRESLVRVVFATGVTGVVGLVLLQLIKHMVAGGRPDYEIEQLFGDARVMTAGLVAAGLLILLSSRAPDRPVRDIGLGAAGWIGAVQGLCLPFRGFSRSGATISAGMMLGVARLRAEEFSFALAVALTPAVVLREGWRLFKSHAVIAQHGVAELLAPGLAGMVLSFLAGLLALRWLSRWLDQGRWYLFGIYCLVAAAVVWHVG
ncbi:undecaprenyl-diphosphate phosphatase [Ramlibacter ginsenosidimutans]|uniref:Undecaprenyl-diphosphatase n=1 Tax=Ramlibacter ginsenosidimutans TaxID=502333 RepID=A0A934TXH8_9BURK|nr:undecaprenyl-diphosphate phosphatase [Ramlibacter ginsenosidimutans]MBK6008725.1 undecaprenyl-diphosphate phosphatase [Ramlibacter ginsenosidimutans]